jgi:hypothetical protein
MPRGASICGDQPFLFGALVLSIWDNLRAFESDVLIILGSNKIHGVPSQMECSAMGLIVTQRGA